MTKHRDSAQCVDLEWRTAPLYGSAEVPLKPDGTPCQQHLVHAMCDRLMYSILPESLDRIAVRRADTRGDWECLLGDDPRPLAVRETSPGRVSLTANELWRLPRSTDDAFRYVKHGDPLWAIAVGDAGRGRAWLEAAVRAGMVPHQKGVELAQHGIFGFTRARFYEELDRGETGQAEAWLRSSDAYRRFAALLVEEAERLEAWRAELFPGPKA